jgi:hypothetical protein
MTPLRFAVLLPWLAAAGCYSDAPSQSTLPPSESHFVAGPPGGAMDPDGASAQDLGQASANEPDDADDPGAGDPAVRGPAAPVASSEDLADGATDPATDPADDAIAGAPDFSAGGPDGAPGELGDPNGAVAEAGPAPVPADPAIAATANVSDAEIDSALQGYGQWIQTDDLGQVWRPDATVVGADFTPYESGGSWEQTDAGWSFASEYPWGWLPYHYGRWAWLGGSWGWVPGHRWGSAWVDWRHGGGITGWRPMGPGVRDHRQGFVHHGSDVVIRDHRRAEQHDAHWRFATDRDFSRPHIRAHTYGNLAEGLRVTSTVRRPPPVQGRTTVRSTDLMRGRFANRPVAQPGRFGGAPQVRDHRSFDRGQAFDRGQGIDRGRTFQPPPAQGGGRSQPTFRGNDGSASRGYTAPTRAYNPPARAGQPDAGQAGRAYNPPARTYQPGIGQTGRAYNPPPRAYNAPPRAYNPPPRAYNPPPVYSPRPTYNPPARTYNPPPVYNPPPRASNPPPVHYSPPPSHTATPSPSPSPAPSRSPSPAPSPSPSGGGRHR